jgi:predicted transcriptional regulator
MISTIGSHDLVVSRILKECIYGASKTRISHQSSPKSLKVESYLDLILNGYIEVVADGPRVIHKTTPKGLRLIEKFYLLHGEMDKLTRNTYA